MDQDFQVWLTQTTEPQTTLAQFTIGSADDADIVTQLRTDCPEWTQRCLFSDKVNTTYSVLSFVFTYLHILIGRSHGVTEEP